MNRFLKSAASGAIFALAAVATAAVALQISGRNTDRYRAIDQVGIAAMSNEIGITATASGTQVNSYQLTAGVSYVSTVATIGDSVKMPSTTALGAPTNLDGSMNIVIINGTANSMNVFPFLATDIMNTNGTASGAGASMAIAAGKQADCWSVNVAGVGKWYCSVG